MMLSYPFKAAKQSRLAFILFFFVFIEGFVSINLEIVIIRQLMPFVGNSVIVTSIIIGLFLLALACGYYRGGCVVNDPLGVLQKNLFFVSLFVGLGFSYPFVAASFYLFNKIYSQLIFSLITYLLLILVPAIYFIGQTVPITMKIFNVLGTDENNGTVLFTNTLGSFLGSVLTSVVLFNHLGIGMTILINIILLLVLSGYLLVYSKQALKLIRLIPVLYIAWQLNVVFENSNFLRTNAYANYEVYHVTDMTTEPDAKQLIINNSHSSIIKHNGEGYPYIEMIKKVIVNLKLNNEPILVIGAGGFTLSSGVKDTNHYTYLDIDSDIKPIVSQYFNPHINGQFVAADARYYLQKSKDIFKMIILDAYTNVNTMPSHLLTHQFLDVVKSKIQENGYFVMNVIANPLLSTSLSRNIDATIRRVFSRCMAMPLEYKDELTNIIYICHMDGGIQAKIYSDHQRQASIDNMTQTK